MKHLGDITKIDGYTVPIVDCVCGGSPCQDLSVANGKRAGLAGERSGLFMEQIRLTKEMREHDRELATVEHRAIRPEFFVWENVVGAMSSGKPRGADFKAVLEEIIRIVEPNAPDLPLPKKWSKAGAIVDERGRFSVCWRTHDAQWFGVPQRRRRISVVADFNGTSAGDILFELVGEAEQGS